MIDQRLYPDIILGNGSASQTVALLGCFETALLQGLIDRGYNYSVAYFNQLLKDKGCFSSKTLLSAATIANNIPQIFTYGAVEAWNDANIIKYMADPSYLVLGEVDARGIGGSGTHFVLIQSIDVENGKIKMTYVGDPWGGLDHEKVSSRYNAYGNILSFRVFKVIIKEGENIMAETMTVNKSDWDRLYKASQLGDKLINGLGSSDLYKGNIADKSEDQIKEMLAAHDDNALQDKYLKGKSAAEGSVVEVTVEGKTAEEIVKDLNVSLNGLKTIEIINGVTVEKNWKL
jgi:hypothetical protein